MSLREQFEAWLKDNYPGIVNRWVDDLEREAEAIWQAYQAGHAVNADLLEALDQIKQAFCDSPAHGALACKMAAIATEAIKKARAE